MHRFVKAVLMMDNATKIDIEQALQERFQHLPPPDWIRAMIDHYRRTGTYRAQDLRRLLGDPTQGVEVGSDASFVACRNLK
jgi:hypothetical protein